MAASTRIHAHYQWGRPDTGLCRLLLRLNAVFILPAPVQAVLDEPVGVARALRRPARRIRHQTHRRQSVPVKEERPRPRADWLTTLDAMVKAGKPFQTA